MRQGCSRGGFIGSLGWIQALGEKNVAAVSQLAISPKAYLIVWAIRVHRSCTKIPRCFYRRVIDGLSTGYRRVIDGLSTGYRRRNAFCHPFPRINVESEVDLTSRAWYISRCRRESGRPRRSEKPRRINDFRGWTGGETPSSGESVGPKSFLEN